MQLVHHVEDGKTFDTARLNSLTDKIIAAAIRVHKVLGPGLLESAYRAALAFELVRMGLSVQREVALPVVYDAVRLDCGYRVDFIVEGLVIIEAKAIERLERVHSAQLLSYLRLTRLKVGLLINFNVTQLRFGIKRVVNGFPE